MTADELKCVSLRKKLFKLKNVCQKPDEAFQALGRKFTKLHAKFNAGTLLVFVNCCKDYRTVPT